VPRRRFGISAGQRDDGILQKRRFGSFLKVCAARNRLWELCRREGLNQNVYYRWSKDFLEAGKKRLAGDTARDATSDEVKDIRAELRQLKEALAETLLENRLLKKSMIADGGDDA
jgi:transposase-like protein